MCFNVNFFSSISINSWRKRGETEKNPGCLGQECKSIDIMYSTSTDSRSNESLLFISHTKNTERLIQKFGVIVTKAGNIAIQYKPLLNDMCEGVFKYEKPYPEDSIGLIIDSLPILFKTPEWTNSFHKCPTAEECMIEFTGTERYKAEVKIELQITSDFHVYRDFPGHELSPKTLHIGISLNNIDPSLLGTQNITMFVVESAEGHLAYSSDEMRLITFGSTNVSRSNENQPINLIHFFNDFFSQHDTSSPFKMIGASAEFVGWRSKFTKTDKTVIPIKATEIKKVAGDLKWRNLLVACFFGDQKGSKVYKIDIMLEPPKTRERINVTWTIIIGLGDKLPPSSSANHTLRNWSIAGGVILLVLALVGGLLYMKGKNRL